MNPGARRLHPLRLRSGHFSCCSGWWCLRSTPRQPCGLRRRCLNQWLLLGEDRLERHRWYWLQNLVGRLWQRFGRSRLRRWRGDLAGLRLLR